MADAAKKTTAKKTTTKKAAAPKESTAPQESSAQDAAAPSGEPPAPTVPGAPIIDNTGRVVLPETLKSVTTQELNPAFGPPPEDVK